MVSLHSHDNSKGIMQQHTHTDGYCRGPCCCTHIVVCCCLHCTLIACAFCCSVDVCWDLQEENPYAACSLCLNVSFLSLHASVHQSCLPCADPQLWTSRLAGLLCSPRLLMGVARDQGKPNAQIRSWDHPPTLSGLMGPAAAMRLGGADRKCTSPTNWPATPGWWCCPPGS